MFFDELCGGLRGFRSFEGFLKNFECFWRFLKNFECFWRECFWRARLRAGLFEAYHGASPAPCV